MLIPFKTITRSDAAIGGSLTEVVEFFDDIKLEIIRTEDLKLKNSLKEEIRNLREKKNNK